MQVKPVKGEYVETLLFDFPMVDVDSARLELHWGTTVVPLLLRTSSGDTQGRTPERSASALTNERRL